MFFQSLVLLALTLTGPSTATEEKAMSAEKTLVKRTTPILVVEEIEPSLPFWASLGFEKTLEAPDGDRLAFVGLQNGDMEIMYQTRAAIAGEVEGAGLPEFMSTAGLRSILYLEVADLDEVRAKLAGLVGVEVLVASRKTPYGAEELWLREPGGHLVGLAAFE